jgi:serine/threonine protein phosphatase PrpC
LLQAIGVTEDLSIDLIVDKPQSGDIYLLCSDGLNKMLSDQRIQEVLARQPDLESAVYGLIELANDAGGRDNVTVVLVKVLERQIHDIATIPVPPPEKNGWSRQPSVEPTANCGFEDETVVGGLPPEVRALQLDRAVVKRSS